MELKDEGDVVRIVNSMTKYPSIPTYHKIDPKTGVLQEEESVTGFREIVATEKINGTNARIIVFPDGDWIIGSREELLTCMGDRIHNPALGIVQAVRGAAKYLTIALDHAHVTVYYMEAYGSGIEGGKAYTRLKGQTGWRIFDVALLPDYEEMLSWPIEKFSGWRERGGQQFLTESALRGFSLDSGMPLVPRFEIGRVPTTLEGVYEMLGDFVSESQVSLDGTVGRAEGLVLRTHDRSVIAKARFEDYERTLRRKGVKI